MSFRIKGPNWKKNRCCGRRLTLKTLPVKINGVQETRVAKTCQVCGAGCLLTDAEVQADPEAQKLLGVVAG